MVIRRLYWSFTGIFRSIRQHICKDQTNSIYAWCPTGQSFDTAVFFFASSLCLQRLWSLVSPLDVFLLWIKNVLIWPVKRVNVLFMHTAGKPVRCPSKGNVAIFEHAWWLSTTQNMKEDFEKSLTPSKPCKQAHTHTRSSAAPFDCSAHEKRYTKFYLSRL